MSRYDRGWNVADDDDDEEDVVEEFFSTSEAFLFLIEATDSMLEPTFAQYTTTQPGDPSQATLLGWTGSAPAKSKMELCLRCALAMMRRKVISSPKDKIGIMIFNTESTSNESRAGYYHLLQPLELVTAKAIKDLKQLLEDVAQDPDLLRRKFKPKTGQHDLPNALSHASTIFRQGAQSARINKHILLITDEDDPLKGHQQLVDVAHRHRKDYYDLGYDFDGIFIPPSPDRPFDLETFYGGLVVGDDEEAEWPTTVKNLAGVLNELLSRLRTKEATKRVAFKVPFHLADGFTIGISGYALVGDEKKRPPVKVDLDTQTGQELITEVLLKDSMTGEDLAPTEIKKYFAVGKSEGEKRAAKIFFEEQEVRKLKTLGMQPSLKLLGFKPRDGNLNFPESIKHSYFIVPEEEAYTGSTRTFAALLQSMLKQDVVGLAVLMPRVISRPQICVMVPQEEKLRADGSQERPPGIHVCQLPFADDIRYIGIEATRSVVIPPEGNLDELDIDDLPDQPAIRAATKIIKKLNTVYNPDNYPNPALNYHYETLAALALEEDIPDPEDRTLPKYASIDKYAGDHIAELRSLIDQDSFDSSRVQVSKGVNSKAKKEEGDPDFDAAQFARQLKAAGDKMKNDEIKAGLKGMGQKVSGTKAVLYARAVEALKQRGYWETSDGDWSDAEVKGSPRKPKPKHKMVVKDEDEISE